MPPYASFSNFSAPDLYQSNKTYSPATGSFYPHLLLLASIPLAFASPRFRGREVFWSSIILGLAISTQADPHFSNKPEIAQPFSQLWSVWFTALEKLFTASRTSQGRGNPLSGPESLFWRIRKGPKEAENLIGFGPAKILWAIALALNLRGANWNYQVKNVPRLTAAEQKSRFGFIVSRGLKALYAFVLADVFNHLWMELFYVAKSDAGYTQIGDVNSKYLTIRDPDLIWRLVKTLAWGPLPYYTINFQYNVISMVAVAAYVSDPEDWPPLFGSLSQVTSVRLFWGKFWHQLIRRAFNTFTGYIIDIFHIPRGTSWSSQAQIWLAFFMSSLFHVNVNLITPAPSNITIEERSVGMFQFFLSQAFAITMEDVVKAIWSNFCGKWCINRSHTVCKRFETIVGWVWVLLSCWVSFPFAADMTLRLRFGDELMLKSSLVGPYIQFLFGILRNHY